MIPLGLNPHTVIKDWLKCISTAQGWMLQKAWPLILLLIFNGARDFLICNANKLYFQPSNSIKPHPLHDNLNLSGPHSCSVLLHSTFGISLNQILTGAIICLRLPHKLSRGSASFTVSRTHFPLPQMPSTYRSMLSALGWGMHPIRGEDLTMQLFWAECSMAFYLITIPPHTDWLLPLKQLTHRSNQLHETSSFRRCNQLHCG